MTDVFEEADAICRADPFFAPLANTYYPAWIESEDGMTGDWAFADERNVVPRWQATLVWFHLLALADLESGDDDDDFVKKVAAIDPDIQTFVQRFLDHFVPPEDTLVRKMFANAGTSECKIMDIARGVIRAYHETTVH